MIGEPSQTQYDWRFRILDFPVRVHPFFWLVTAFLGMRGNTPRGTMIWIAVVFVSVLIHELGHAVLIRYFGAAARIVLYSFGGLAITENGYGYGGRERTPQQQIVISLAGPFAGFLLAGVVIVCLFATQRFVDFPLLGQTVRFGSGANAIVADANREIAPMSRLVFDLLWVNIYWGILNLLPIYPLDGGQVARQLFLMNSNDGIKMSLQLSMFTAGGIAVWGLLSGETYLAFMFGFLAYSGYQQLYGNPYRGRSW